MVLLLLGLVASLQYWRGRRLNLTLIRELKADGRSTAPQRKNYTWIGGYVAYGRIHMEDEITKGKGHYIAFTPSQLAYLHFTFFWAEKTECTFNLSQKESKGPGHVFQGKSLPH